MIQEWKNTLLRGQKKEAYDKHANSFDKALERIYDKSISLKSKTDKEYLPKVDVFLSKIKELESKYKAARADYLNPNKFDVSAADEAVKGIDRGALEPLTNLLDQLEKEDKEKAAADLKTMDTLFWTIVMVSSCVGILTIFLFTFLIAKVINSINASIATLQSTSEKVAEVATHVSQSSMNVSEAATEQSSSLEETAASLEEISAMISKAAESANSAALSSTESQQKAEEGRVAADQMLTSMVDISQSNDSIVAQINESNQKMGEIVSVIQEIGNKTKVINEIVFQTKLLSFNASVEAARAGEHGKGFAVVAEEVGNLAQMSGNAAKEISDMLDGSISKVDSIVKETRLKVEQLVVQGKAKVESGMSVARQCSEVLNEIVHNVSKVSSLSQEISQASKEQAQGVAEINKAMGQLDTVNQQNTTTSHEASTSAQQLSSEAVMLKGIVENLVFVVQGKKASHFESDIKFQQQGNHISSHNSRIDSPVENHGDKVTNLYEEKSKDKAVAV
jgi:methyl-accepting chemotaxis protein